MARRVRATRSRRTPRSCSISSSLRRPPRRGDIVTRGRQRIPALVSSLLILSAAPCVRSTRAEEPPCHQSGAATADHYGRVPRTYQVPDVSLIDQNGRSVGLRGLLDTSRSAFVNFIFTTCGTVCPVLSAGFAGFQHSIGDGAARPLLVSITIDPEHDTPEVLHAYARRFGANDGWLFLTGSRRDIDSVMEAFEVDVPNRMNHRPVTLVHGGDPGRWRRIEGFMSVADYAKEYAALADR